MSDGSGSPDASSGLAERLDPGTALLVVSATRAEAAHVPSRFEVLITGIGKVAAATAVASTLARKLSAERGHGPDGLVVVNIGTAGALRDDVSGMCFPSRVLNHDISAEILRGMGFHVDDALSIDHGDGRVLATGDAFVSEEGAREALARRASLVDMEGFAVAHACANFGVRCRLVKHISDNADASALDWASQVDASARALGAWLDAFAPAG